MGILELFAGIGGCAAAAGRGVVCAAVDQDEAAHAVYTANFDHAAHRWNLAGVRAEQLAALGADVWWMSPPCQPFTVRGHQRDVDDPRCRALLHLLDVLEQVRPRALALENVPGFAGSRAHARLTARLDALGYAFAQGEVCPSEWGVPNRRRRFYLVARRDGSVPRLSWERIEERPLSSFLDATVDPDLYVSDALKRRYAGALAVVRADDAAAVAHCFTSAYGRSPVYAGSYLHDARGLRRFSPDEVLRLLGFAPPLRWPEGLDVAKRYKLAGNSLSVPVARQILRFIDAA